MSDTNFSVHRLSMKAFKPTKFACESTDTFRIWLSLDDRASVARLAIGRSLNVLDMPSVIDEEPTSSREIKGIVLLGDDAALWVALVCTHANLSSPTEQVVSDLIRRHWHRGMKLIEKDWRESGKGIVSFLQRLATIAELPFVPDKPTGGDKIVDGPVTLRLGEIGTFVSDPSKIAEWTINATGVSPHFAMFGKSGTGKTRTAKNIYRQLSERRVPMLIFDPKGDIGQDTDLVNELGATVLQIGKDPIPLNCLELRDGDETGILRTRDSFCDAINMAVSLGEVQQNRLREIAGQCIKSSSGIGATEVAQAVVSHYNDAGLKPDRLHGISSMISEYKLFDASRSCDDFFSKTWVISANDASEDQIRLCLLLLLSTLLRWLRGLPDTKMSLDKYRQLRLLLSIDEAKTVFERAEPATLDGLVLECRSKGLSCFFLSQTPEHVEKGSDEILGQLSCVASFEADLQKVSIGKRLFGESFSASKLARLDRGTCLVKLPGIPSTVVRAWDQS
jgi:DNA sulfur modification protein DndE